MYYDGSFRNTLASEFKEIVPMSIGITDVTALEIARTLRDFPESKRTEILEKVREKLGIGAVKLVYRPFRAKPLAELTGLDIPPGLDAEDVASDCAPKGEDTRFAADDVIGILHQRDPEILKYVEDLFSAAKACKG